MSDIDYVFSQRHLRIHRYVAAPSWNIREAGGAVYHGSTLLTSQYFVGCVILSTCNIVEKKVYNPFKSIKYKI
jgi:hypothetical protein